MIAIKYSYKYHYSVLTLKKKTICLCIYMLIQLTNRNTFQSQFSFSHYMKVFLPSITQTLPVLKLSTPPNMFSDSSDKEFFSCLLATWTPPTAATGGLFWGLGGTVTGDTVFLMDSSGCGVVYWLVTPALLGVGGGGDSLTVVVADTGIPTKCHQFILQTLNFKFQIFSNQSSRTNS